MKNKISKLIYILLAFTIFTGVLSGCGVTSKTEVATFRDVPLGIKFEEAIPLFNKELGKQKAGIQPIIFANGKITWADYEKIKLYDYTTTVRAHFINEVEDSPDNSLFYEGEYLFEIKDDAEREKCYNYFYDKLKELYGEENKEYSGFVKDDLVVQIYKSNYDWVKHVTISYYSIQLMKQLDEQDQNNEKERQDSINSGL